MDEAMKWLSNDYDQKRHNLRKVLITAFGETIESAVERYKRWLAGKIIGEPRATDKYTVEELKKMGMVGVYEPDRS